MDNQNKPEYLDELESRFRDAAHKQETIPFASSEKIWSRLEDRMDQHVLRKQNHLWRNLAIAASLLLLVTLGYQVWPRQEIIEPQDAVVVAPSPKSAETTEPKSETVSPAILPNAGKILEKQLAEPSVAVSGNVVPPATESVEEVSEEILKSKKAIPSSKMRSFQKGQAFDALGVRRDEVQAVEAESDKVDSPSAQTLKQAPLVVIDGKPITGKDAQSITTVADGVAKADPDGDKEVVVLKEPLYIIDGHYYSEAEMFGPNATSPYAPLNQQEIETIKVLQGDAAVKNYGKRGEKGVVIITTKNRKPAEAKAVKDKAK